MFHSLYTDVYFVYFAILLLEIRCWPFDVVYGQLQPWERSYLPGENVTVECDQGYIYSGPPHGYLTCTNNWSWFPDAVAVCRPSHQEGEFG